jgi:hypothetical protein
MRTCDGTQRIRRSSRNNQTKEARKSRMAGEFKKPDVISLALALQRELTFASMSTCSHRLDNHCAHNRFTISEA